MSSNSFGKNLKITTFGESHGKAMGVVIDGCPAGLEISETYIQDIMKERSSGGNKYTTPRKESDKVEILSGIYQGKTLGTPIAMMVFNEDIKSKDYNNLIQTFRPSHADYTWYNKFKHRDPRGGGRSSARETVARVAAASIAYKILEKFDIKIYGFLSSIYDTPINYNNLDYNYINQNPFFSPDPDIVDKWQDILQQVISEKDSVGGIIDIHIKGCPVGLGNPVFDKLNSRLAQAIFSIPAVKGLEFGAGFNLAKMKGSQANDSMYSEDIITENLPQNTSSKNILKSKNTYPILNSLKEKIFSDNIDKEINNKDTFNIPKVSNTKVSNQKNFSQYLHHTKKVNFASNNNGGILGGISSGEDIVMKIAMKPTSSIGIPQQTINSQLENITIEISGRHDPCVAIRAVSVVKAMCALVLADFLLEAKDNI